jgi:hypothetical protein
VSVTVIQQGGRGGEASTGGNGGDGAESVIQDAVDGSTAGLLKLSQSATGGAGGSVIGIRHDGRAGTGGDAIVGLTFENSKRGGLELSLEATGGDGGNADRGEAGDGGGAIVERAIGTSSSGGAVTVLARAVGGSGGSVSQGSGRAGSGGNAFSPAYASSAGTGTVTVTSSAVGGAAGSSGLGSPSASGGDAFASAAAEGQDEVVATSFASRGTDDRPDSNSTAAARAKASVLKPEIVSILAQTSGVNQSSVRTESRAIMSGPMPDATLALDRDAFSFGVGLPREEDVVEALSGNEQVAERFSAEGVQEMLAFGFLGSAATERERGDSILLDADMKLTLDLSLVSVLDEVFLGFLDPVSTGSRFDELHLFVGMGDETIVDEFFINVQDALAFLDDKAILLSDLEPGNSPQRHEIRVGLSFVTDDPSAGFGVDFLIGATPIPEPSTFLLLLVGLASAAVVARGGRLRR